MKRFKHNLSHYHMTTFDQGYLVPVSNIEVIMGDSIRQVSAAMMRVAPLAAPVMHPVDVRLHHWFVPYRVIWDEWDEFITGRASSTFPTITYTSGVSDYTLLDRMGVPDDTNTINALPVRAYNLIYNEFYRDDDLITAVSTDDLALKRIAWEKDYFTSARLTAQQGSTVAIPFGAGNKAPVKNIGIKNQGSYATQSDVYESGNTSTTSFDGWQVKSSPAGAGQAGLHIGRDTGTGYPDIYADLSAATGGGIDINEFRLAMAMQKHQEARSRFGDRIQDYLAYHGIRPRDGRLEIPEYLGGGKSTVSFSEVLSTSDSGLRDVGDMTGHGIASVRTRPFGRFFAESGIMMTLMSVRPKTIYANALHRKWLRSDKWDYWQKEAEELGPQEVLTKEVYAAHGNSTDVFGYNGRHDDFRRHPSYVSGAFRDSTDDFWHMARQLSSSPTLNQSFVECSPTDRVYLDTSEPEVRVMCAHDIKAKRLVRRKAKH